MEASVASLRFTAARGSSATKVEARLLDVPGELADLFPDGGIRRGSTVAVGPLDGGCSVALSLAAAVTGHGYWAAVVGMPSLGLVAAAEIGVDLARLALIPTPGEQWPAVVAALIDGFDLILLRPPLRVRGGDARRLAARVRERGSVLALMDFPDWPETPEIRLTVTSSVWEGLGAGHGLLRSRRMEVVSGGRRAAGRERRLSMCLPDSGPGMSQPGSGPGMSQPGSEPGGPSGQVVPRAG